MRLSFSTAALYPTTTLDSLALLRSCGFREAEIMPQCYEECRPSFANKVLQTGIRVSSIHFPLVFFSVFYNPYPGMMEEAKIIANELAKSAKIMGCDVVVVHAPSKKDDPIRELHESPILENIRYLADILEPIGTKLVVENSPTTVANTPEGLLNFLRVLDHDNSGPMVDTTESWEAQIEPSNFIRQVKPLHLHLSDHSTNHKHLPIGEGDSDWKSIFCVLKEIKYSGIYVIEPTYRFYLEHPEKKIINDREYIEKVLNAI